MAQDERLLPPLLSLLLSSPPLRCLKGLATVFSFFFFPPSSAKFWRNEFISAPRFGLGEMKYNGGGPGAWWGDVSTEGKLLFVCLSLTLGLPFISLQGCGAVFTPGQLFSASPSALFFLPLLFMLSLKALLDDHQGLPLKLSSPHFCVLSSNYPDSPSSARNSQQGDLLFFPYVNLWKRLGQVVFNIGIFKGCANGMLVFCWKNDLITIIMSVFAVSLARDNHSSLYYVQ